MVLEASGGVPRNSEAVGDSTRAHRCSTRSHEHLGPVLGEIPSFSFRSYCCICKVADMQSDSLRVLLARQQFFRGGAVMSLVVPRKEQCSNLGLISVRACFVKVSLFSLSKREVLFGRSHPPILTSHPLISPLPVWNHRGLWWQTNPAWRVYVCV